MCANRLLDSAKPGFIEPSDHSAAKKGEQYENGNHLNIANATLQPLEVLRVYYMIDHRCFECLYV